MEPKISVIIPAFNEEKLLPRCLEALHNQSYPRDKFEVILIDNDSIDKTVEIGHDFGVRVYSYKNMYSPGTARKLGAEKAKGSIIAYTDADCIVFPDWLETIERAISDPQIVCIGGLSIPDKKTLWFTSLFTLFDWVHVVNHIFGKPIMPGYNMAIKKEAYEAVGGMNDKILSAEDWDLAMRVGKRFGKKSVRYIRDMKVYTSTRKQDDLRVFLRYAKDGWKNYISVVLLGKTEAATVFNVR